MNIQEKISNYQFTINKASNWLESLQDNNGEIEASEDGAFYYRLLWTWTVLGRTKNSQKLIEWIKSEEWHNGNIGKTNPILLTKHYSYIFSNLVIGLYLNNEYKLALQGLNTLLRYQDKNSGGFQNAHENLEPNGLCENWTSAQIGMAFLLAGEIEVARKTGDFLIKNWEMQNDIENQLFFVYDVNSKSLLKDSDEAGMTYILNKEDSRQWFWGPGLVAAFLCHLYRYTQDSKYLTYAKKYQDFVQSCTEKQFDGIEVCKTGLGAAELYSITKDEKYRDWAIKVGDYFCKTQKADGRWVDDRFSPSTLGQDIAITDQQALWLNYIVRALV